MKNRLLVVALIVAAIALPRAAFAGVRDPATIASIQMWNGWNQIVVILATGERLWFDGSTANGKNLLALMTSAYLAAKPIYVSWNDTADANILGASASNISGFTIHN